MLITKIENLSKIKFKVYIDEEFAFVLYKGEISRYKIKEGHEIEEELFYRIKNEVLVKRAKKRTLHLLEQLSRTEQQIRLKLKQSYYTHDIIDEAINYAKDFGYIQDETFATNFTQWKKTSKSKKEIYFSLLQKGVNKETAQQILESNYKEDDEQQAILKHIRKKTHNLETIDKDGIKKLNQYLMRKGFSYEAIRQALELNIPHIHEL